MIPLLCRGGDQLTTTVVELSTSTMGDDRSTGGDSAVVTETPSLDAQAYTVHTSTCEQRSFTHSFAAREFHFAHKKVKNQIKIKLKRSRKSEDKR